MAASVIAAPVGRQDELDAVDRWLTTDAAEPVLLLEGSPGIGKTTVWAAAVQRAREQGRGVLQCRPAAADASLPYAGLTDLLSSLPGDPVDGLPGPQRRALRVVTLREDAGREPLDLRTIGTALVTLLGVLADAAPLLIAVDDLQWLDRASLRTLAFAMGRIDGNRVRLLASARTESEQPAALFDGDGPARERVRRLRLAPLSVASLHHVFERALNSSFPRPLLIRVHDASGGNPFYALEIAYEIERVGAPPPGRPLPVPADQRGMAMLRVRRLPRATRDALAHLAAISRPATADVDLTALAPAEAAGLVAVQPGGGLSFTHPLFAAAIYGSLPEADRRTLHRDLAGRATLPEERARHLALAASGPDEATAVALDAAADAAAARGATDLVLELMELAVQLTPEQERAGALRRRIDLAERRYFAGDARGARLQLEALLGELAAGEERARVLLELGSVLWTQGQEERGLALMLQALDETASSILRARIHCRISAMSEDCDAGVTHAEAALALIAEDDDPLTYSSALHNAARWKLFSGRGADHDAVARGIRLQRQGASWEVSILPAYWASYFDDFEEARTRFSELVRTLRERGDEARLCFLTSHLAVIEAFTGRMSQARALVTEGLDLATQTGQNTWLMVARWAEAQVAVRGGDLPLARTAANAVVQQAADEHDITMENMARAVLGLAALCDGDLGGADRQFSRCDEILASYHAREPAPDRYHADHVEAVVGLGELERAERMVSRLEDRAAALPRPWIVAVTLRSGGLLQAARGDGDAALGTYQRALEAHRRLAVPSELGRTLLALGQLERRRKARAAAQAHLAEAVRVFTAAGADHWAAAAQAELARARGHRGDGAALTATEQGIAELAAAGLRNREIAARMFVSEKTVEAYLSHVFAKLEIRSRAELGRRLPPRPDRGSTA